MTTEIYQLKIDGKVCNEGSFEECIDDVYWIHKHKNLFQTIKSVELTLIQEAQ